MTRSPVVHIDKLRFRFPGSDRDVLDINHLSVSQGKRIFIKGPSGCGKSTLLSLIGGVNVPTHGHVSVLDTSISDLRSSQRDHFRADHIGFIFQMFNLIPYLSVIDNVTLPCRFSNTRQSRALQRGHSLNQEAERLLNHLGLDDPFLLRRNVTDLSMGQQQRVAAARALIGSPGIVIADEPTSSLDADSRESFLQLLFNECEEAGATLIFVSHDPYLQSLFDQTIELTDINRVAEVETVSDYA